MKTTITIIISIAVGFGIAWSIPVRKIITKEISIITEIKKCEDAGGYFSFNDRTRYSIWRDPSEKNPVKYELVCSMPSISQPDIFNYELQ